MYKILKEKRIIAIISEKDFSIKPFDTALAMDWVLPSIELCVDASLGNGQSLLLHPLVQQGLVASVILSNSTTDTIVSEDQGTCLKHQLLRVQVLGDEGGQTLGSVSLASSVLVLVGSELVHLNRINLILHG
jgi:hypothetical protein